MSRNSRLQFAVTPCPFQRFPFGSLVRSARASLVPLFALVVLASQASAVPIAYWRFGDDPADPFFGNLTDGDWLQPTSGRTQIDVDPDPINPPAYVPGYDSTGNGNTLYGWDAGGAGWHYRADVPAPAAGGSANAWSIQNDFSFPAAFTWSQQSSPSGTDLQTWTSSQWTVEASFKPETLAGGYKTIVGREGNEVAPDPNAAPLYFQITDDVNGSQLRINFTDAAGNNHVATSTGVQFIPHQWYHAAATSDGTTLNLYLDQFDGTGYQNVASLNISGSANPALVDPGLDANGDSWGWTVGRGRYGTSDNPNDDHGDRFFGNIDEVRISDTALAPGSFLFAGQNLGPGPRLVVNRSDGSFTLQSMQANIDVVSYTITSAGEALNPAAWLSIADNYDSDSTAVNKFDPNNTWTEEVMTNSQLTETEFIGNGGQLGTGGTATSVQLGGAGAWTLSRYEDLEMTIQELQPDGISLSTYTIPVVFTGGSGETANRSDLNLDGSVNDADWVIFAANHLDDFTGMTIAAASVFGDIDGDLDNDYADFLLFEDDYDAANGGGALRALISSVPEPASVALMALAACAVFCLRRR